jgi:hypothetical protein
VIHRHYDVPTVASDNIADLHQEVGLLHSSSKLRYQLVICDPGGIEVHISEFGGNGCFEALEINAVVDDEMAGRDTV